MLELVERSFFGFEVQGPGRPGTRSKHAASGFKLKLPASLPQSQFMSPSQHPFRPESLKSLSGEPNLMRLPVVSVATG